MIEFARALLPALRETAINRRPPRAEHCVFYTRSTDDVTLFCTLLGRNARDVVIVAHPAVVGSYYGQVVNLAEELAGSYSVILFDFRGHGRSTGRFRPGFAEASRDLEAVVGRARSMGFEKVGVAGFSLGAAAAMLLLSRGECFDSLVSVGCPPGWPDVRLLDEKPLLARAAMRLLGMRLDPRVDAGEAPIDVAASLPCIPKFLIFGEWEVAPPEEVASFAELVAEPKRVLTVPGAWHADLLGREPLVREFFDETL